MRVEHNQRFGRILLIVLPASLCLAWLSKEYELTSLRRAAVDQITPASSYVSNAVSIYGVPAAAQVSAPVAGPICSAAEREALARVADSLHGQLNWGHAANCCEWKGVACTDGGEVRGLSLAGEGLHGTLPTQVGALRALATLDVNDNPRLSGTLPTELGAALRLTHVYAFGCSSLSGTLPSALPPSLQELELSRCRLSGTLPPQLGSLGSLRYAFLESNRISGVVPPSLARLRQLKELELSSNRLSGSVPRAVAAMALQHLDIKDNSPQLRGAPVQKPGHGCSGGTDRYLRGGQAGQAPTRGPVSANPAGLEPERSAAIRPRRRAMGRGGMRQPWKAREETI